MDSAQVVDKGILINIVIMLEEQVHKFNITSHVDFKLYLIDERPFSKQI